MLERMIGSVQAKDVCSMMGDGPALKNSDVIELILQHSASQPTFLGDHRRDRCESERVITHCNASHWHGLTSVSTWHSRTFQRDIAWNAILCLMFLSTRLCLALVDSLPRVKRR